MAGITEIDELLTEEKIEEAIKLCEKYNSPEVFAGCARTIGWYFYGKKNDVEALRWFNKAVDLHDVESLYGVACTYLNWQDYASALQVYKEASDRGYPRANYWIGYLYEHGLGTSESREMAKEYYVKGVNHGYLMAERALIHLKLRDSSSLGKIVIFFSYLALLIKAFFIAKNDVTDERLADVPNAFADRYEK